MKKTNIKTEKHNEAPGGPRATGPASADEPVEPLVAVQNLTVTADQLEELKERAAKADENWERLLRTTADFENFKKRAAREK